MTHTIQYVDLQLPAATIPSLIDRDFLRGGKVQYLLRALAR